MGILIAIIVCISVIVIFKYNLINITINVNHRHTNVVDVTPEMVAFQEELNKQAEEDKKKRDEEITDMEDIFRNIMNEWKGEDEDEGQE